jgi:hypothetical protein
MTVRCENRILSDQICLVATRLIWNRQENKKKLQVITYSHLSKKSLAAYIEIGLLKINDKQTHPLLTKTKIINRIFSSILIFLNTGYFIPLSYKIIKTEGGTWGYGLVVLPLILLTHLFLISAIGSWFSKNKNPIMLLVINTVGLMWTLFWFWLFITVQRID